MQAQRAEGAVIRLQHTRQRTRIAVPHPVIREVEARQPACAAVVILVTMS